VRLTIERIRTAVLIAGGLLLIALGVFLTIGQWRSHFNRSDLPKKLGIDIQQEANGFTQAEFSAGHAKFKITASRVEQLKDNRYRLHTVKIEMYEPDGGGPDRIEGSEFEYDQQSGVAKAAGQVEITLNRPQSGERAEQQNASQKTSANGKARPSASARPDPATSQIHVQTSGLTFDNKNGVATTNERVQFQLAQGTGSSIGASYDSQNGKLVLNNTVELNTYRNADPVHLVAQHGEIERGDNLCRLSSATVRFHNGDAWAQQATILFTDDGMAQQLDASNGLRLTTATGTRLTSATGTLKFDDDNQPQRGHLEGGVTIDSDNAGRKVHGTAPTAELAFDSHGLLRHAHLERNVNFASDEQTDSLKGPLHIHRDWASPFADLEFRNAGKGQVALDSVHGIGGVVVTSVSQRANGPAAHARMTADDMRGLFGSDSSLNSMTGTGHAHLEQTTETGTRQTTSGDRLDAHFHKQLTADRKSASQSEDARAGSTQIESATVIGNVALFQQPAAKPGMPAPAPLQATAARADYDGVEELLHLTGNPRVENGGLQLTADKIDVARVSGDAFAYGNVKATWLGNGPAAGNKQVSQARNDQGPNLGTQGPSHVVAAEAQLRQQTGETTFRGHARLWQQANSVAAPVIILDRTKQTLVARTEDSAEPVRVVLLSAATPGQSKTAKSDSPSVIRVRGGDLKYSDAERKAIMHSGVLDNVVAETPDATTRSSEVELILLPPGNHAGRDGGSAQVDRMTGRGHVTIDSQGRQGTGDQLAYSSANDEYVLTGSAAVPPRMTDPARGTVTGGALIFNSRDDSVSVEGDGRKTTTETTAPKRP